MTRISRTDAQQKRGRPMHDGCTLRERQQFRELKKEALERGRSEHRAEEIANRIMKKRQHRSKSGASNPMTAVNPYTKLEACSHEELLDRARHLAISGREKMTRNELIQAIRDRS